MAAQIVLDFRCEPAQVEVAIGARDDKGGLRVPVFCRDLLHGAVGRKRRQDTDTGWIAGKDLLGEGIDVVIRVLPLFR
jgi:hypothetical protein